ncbi:MAG: Gfo/Idh/MocA family oxidoreductase [Armatimonadota bacterium]|nr:Gfo/Idh/MocA family oxidoreductase [Armatimonadota bacterium]
MVRVGVVGLRRGWSLLRTFAAFPAADVAAACDTDSALLERAGRELGVPALYTRYEELLAHPLDVVVVASPLPLHAAHSIAALQCDRHVLSEVPAVASLEEGRALAAAARRSRGRYMLAENCCWWAFIEAWREMVAAGRIGKVVYAEAEYVHDCRRLMRDAAGQPTWRAAMPPIQYCTHSLGPLLWITGDRCLTTCGAHTGCNVAPELGAIDMEVAVCRTQSGGVFKILCGFSVVREPAFHYYTLYGTRGCLERARGEDKTFGYFADDPNAAGMVSLPLSYVHPNAPAGATVGGHGTCEYYMVAAFLQSLREGREPPIGVDLALDMTLPGICAHLSAEQGGKPVEVPNPRDWS